MRFYRDRSDVLDVDWYFVDADTPPMPWGSAFGSSVWDDWHAGITTVGEQQEVARPFRSGLPVGSGAGTGPPCGSATDWAMGLATIPATPVVLDAFGTPVCCARRAGPFQFFSCVFCPTGAWSSYTLTATGGTLGFQGGNGVWELAYVGDCTWESVGFVLFLPASLLYFWRLYKEALGWKITYARLGTAFQWDYPIEPPLWDCQAARLGVKSPRFNPPPAEAQPSVSIVPGVPILPPLGCANLSARTYPAYYLTWGRTPTLPPFEDSMVIRAGTYVVFESRPCTWEGEVDLTMGLQIQRSARVPVTLTVRPGGLPTVRVVASELGNIFADGYFVGVDIWDGTAFSWCPAPVRLPGAMLYIAPVRINAPVPP